MKVAQEIDVDNVTIIINPQNKLEAKIPTNTPSEVVIEEVPNVTPVNAVVTLNGTTRRIVKLGKVNGTEWLVFQLDNPPPPKPDIQKNIRLEFYDDVGTSSGGGMTFNHTGKIRVTTEDGSSFTPNGSSVYESFTDSDVKLFYDGNTESQIEVKPMINFNTMTYQVDVHYGDVQTSSTLVIAHLKADIGLIAEHEDAIYYYQITEVSRGADTPA